DRLTDGQRRDAHAADLIHDESACYDRQVADKIPLEEVRKSQVDMESPRRAGKGLFELLAVRKCRPDSKVYLADPIEFTQRVGDLHSEPGCVRAAHRNEYGL